MTDLSNIFFGKKVVQKAYLNNALIYQSKGWQTLPSTCTEVWTKSYEKVGSIGAIVKDEDDNIYIGAGNTVYKVDPDGNLKWKCAVGTVTAMITAIVVYPTYIYCSDNIGDFFKIDINGNLLSNSKITSFLPVSSTDYIVDMQKDDDYIYAIAPNKLIKLNSNLAVIDNVGITNNTCCLTTNNGPYVFVGTNNYGIRFEKNNLKNSTNLPGYSYYFVTGSITLDNIGNLYLGSHTQSVLLKYDVESCGLITDLSSSYISDLCTDNQENCYIAVSSVSLKKYSSDGTLIWDNVPIPASNNNMKVITDSNNNIYVAYIDSNGMLTIKKFINLVKEN